MLHSHGPNGPESPRWTLWHRTGAMHLVTPGNRYAGICMLSGAEGHVTGDIITSGIIKTIEQPERLDCGRGCSIVPARNCLHAAGDLPWRSTDGGYRARDSSVVAPN